ncbi:hypothetical protein KEM52_004358 [Ascosphaera acerosa]|nr:hypothetical protein KEM52_004358 [Ascosphaera acerosa]
MSTTPSNPVAYLKSIQAVRERAQLVMHQAAAGRLLHFDVDRSKLDAAAQYVVDIIKRDYASDYASIPPHGRWQHFEVGGRRRVDELLQAWPGTVDARERTRRLLDLFVVSVLLDAGAGARWTYTSNESGETFNRSEGLAVASLEMFQAGLFSGDPAQPHRVDRVGLGRLTAGQLARGLQHSDSNPLAGLEGRAGLLERLAVALRNEKYFGGDGRPGNMLANGSADWLLDHRDTTGSQPTIKLTTLWTVLTDGLGPIWPQTRTAIDGVSLGDAWPCKTLSDFHGAAAQPWQSIMPFHKLTQWMCYSLMVPIARVLGAQFSEADLLTGLPEYRNGGLLADIGVLVLKPDAMARGRTQSRERAQEGPGQSDGAEVPLFAADDDVIVEWRALTVGLLDELLGAVNTRLGLLEDSDRLTLAQLLEAGSWKGGREIAAELRPDTKGPPIMIISDGTVF